MACRIRYLNSAGIHRREIPGIEALARSLPDDWLIYASLQHYPAREAPIELDAMVVMQDRVLLLEIKDWNGELRLNGDNWIVGSIPRGRSPVDVVSGKAKKIATALSGSIAGFAGTFVDSAVVMTGTMDVRCLPADKRRKVLTLEQACCLATPEGRSLLAPVKLSLSGPLKLEPEFERATRNTRRWAPLEAVWDGYRVVEEDVVVHPRQIWREHRAELARDGRLKALLRIWNLDLLPPLLNSPEARRRIVDQEIRVAGHMSSIHGGPTSRGLLQPLGAGQPEVLTQHYELRSLRQHWTTLDRWLERNREELAGEDRALAATALLGAVAEIHSAGIAHRDLGPRSVWIGDASDVALSGFAASRMPDDVDADDCFEHLRDYGPPLPEDGPDVPEGSWMHRDVYALGLLVSAIFGFQEPASGWAGMNETGGGGPVLGRWLARALARNPKDRFQDAIEAASELAAAFERRPGEPTNPGLLDAAESRLNPYVDFRPLRDLALDVRRHTYVAAGPAGGPDRTVKVWLRIGRGASVETDIALGRLFDGVGRLQASRVSGLPDYKGAFLSPVGPFVTYVFEEGRSLEGSSTLDQERGLRLARDLLHCVTSLHASGLSHGDLHEGRIVIRDDGTPCLLGLFDIGRKGGSRGAHARRRPSGWESLTEQHLDRYAVVAVIADMLELTGEERLCDVVGALREEVARPAVETLDVATAIIRSAGDSVEAAKAPHFQVGLPFGWHTVLEADNGRYHLRTRSFGQGRVEYTVTGLVHELKLLVSSDAIESARVVDVSYSSLAHATARGVPASFGLSFTTSAVPTAPGLIEFVARVLGDSGLLPEEGEPRHGDLLDVRRYWSRMLEAEESLRPIVEITAAGERSGAVSVYPYGRVSGEFDFDPESTVEVLSGDRRVGTLDLARSDERSIAVRLANRPLLAGDQVALADLRERTSLDRRRKAVQRILQDEAAVEGLFDYLTPVGRTAVDYGSLGLKGEDLGRYGLNGGQREAFSHLLQHGPVGLLQGPPGTGKTRFIAAFVHWLATKGGARRILIASQSHEGVNNAIEAIVDVYRRLGGRPSLVRIGSKGITDKIRPYHTTALRQRLQVRFETAFKARVVLMGSALGLRKPFAEAAVEIDTRLGAAGRHLQAVVAANTAAETRHPAARERRRNQRELHATEAAYRLAAGLSPGQAVDPEQCGSDLDRAYAALLAVHPGTSPADVAKVRALIAMAREFSAALESSGRNIEEFLGKTRGVVTATCVGVGQAKMRIDAGTFDWVIVDEAARCTPGELAVPIQVGRRVLLVGDHLQLEPMIDQEVLEELAADMPDVDRKELKRSDFERARLSDFGKANGRILTEQYRMEPAICDLISRIFYEPHHVRLTTSPEREANAYFSGKLPFPLEHAVCWVDTTTDKHSVERKPDWMDSSTLNEAEVHAIMGLLGRISVQPETMAALAATGEETPIGVICMYKAQKVRIEQEFARGVWPAGFKRLVRIETVDSYQGKENAIVIVSLVRSNGAHEPGHVASPNRCNVALSRAKHRLFVVGSAAMWRGTADGQPMRRVVEWCDGAGNGATTIGAGRL